MHGRGYLHHVGGRPAPCSPSFPCVIRVNYRSAATVCDVTTYRVVQVLYHLFEGLSAIGVDNIKAVDVIAGVGSFFVICLGAPAIGILLGFLGGFLSRFTHHIRIMEPLLVVIICYIAFVLPELFHLSGILG